MNIALAVAEEEGGLVQFENLCMELVDSVRHKHSDVDCLWIESAAFSLPGPCLLGRWTYHAVPVIGGVVHDAWHPEVMLPPAEYVEAVFGDVFWEMNPGDREE